MREVKLIEPKGKRRDSLGSINGPDQTNQANPRPTDVLRDACEGSKLSVGGVVLDPTLLGAISSSDIMRQPEAMGADQTYFLSLLASENQALDPSVPADPKEANKADGSTRDCLRRKKKRWL